MARTTDEIKTEIEARLGFVPPFFRPAFVAADILENLWQQTLGGYLNNPLPDVFKEKLAAVISRYCSVPYCMMCHSASLRPLGLTASEVLSLLETPAATFEELRAQTDRLGTEVLDPWPEPGSAAEKAIIACCVSIFLEQNFEFCQRKLKQLLRPSDYQHLNIFIAYNRTALSWAEMNPEISAETDARVSANMRHLLASEPKLTDFLNTHRRRAQEQSHRQSKWLNNESHKILDSERQRLNSYFAQAPVGFAVLEEPDHRFVMANPKFTQLTGISEFSSKAIRSVLVEQTYSSLFDRLDQAFETGVGFVDGERRLVWTSSRGEQKEFFVDVTAEVYRNEDGRISGLFVILNDVTEQVKTRAARHRSDEFMRTTLISIGDAVMATTADPEPKVVFLNKAGESMTGWSLSEAEGRPVDEVFNIVDVKTRAKAFDPIGQVLENGQASALANGTVLISRSGREHVIEDNAAPILDEHGAVAGVVLVFRDVGAKIAAEEQAKLLSAVVRASKDFIGLANVDGKCLYLNPAGRALTGLGADQDISGLRIIDYFPEHERGRITSELLPLVSDKGHWDGRVLFENFATGEEIPVSWNVFTIPDVETGRILAYSCVSRDLREQEAVEATRVAARTQIDAANYRLKSLLMQMPIGVCLFEGAEHRYTFSNSEFDELFALPIADDEGVLATHHALDRLNRVALSEVFRTGRPFYEDEYAIESGGGSGDPSSRYLNLAYEAMTDSENVTYGVSVTAVDVSDLVNGRKGLEQKDFRLTLALDAAQIGTWDLNPGTRELIWSDRGAKMHGFEGVTATSYETFMARVHADDRAKVDQSIAASTAVNGAGSYDVAYRILLSTGEVRTIQAAGRTVFHRVGGRRVPIQFTGTVIDVTGATESRNELLAARQQAELANTAKSAFLANMSHEIRSPLGAILGFCGLLKAPDTDEQQRKNAVEVVDRNAQHLLRVIDDILDLSKVEAGKMSIEKMEFSLAELISDFASIMTFKAREKGIDFSLRIDGEVPGLVISDPTRVRQILNNVVGNAIKFTERGHVSMIVAYADDRLRFTITDTGVGMTDEQRRKLFRPFEQADVSTTRKFGGTGLGLVLTRRLCELLGGEFELRASEPDVGSTFEASIGVFLPAKFDLIGNESLSDKTRASTSPAHLRPVLEGMKLLVVDDSPDNQALFDLILRKLGASVDLASDGRDGLDQASRGEHDVVLMDVQMPRMDGYEATGMLRQAGYVKPIIALTAHAMKEEKDRAIAAGFTDFLSKPVHRDSMIEMLIRHGGATPANQ